MASQFSSPIYNFLTSEHSGLHLVLRKVEQLRQINQLLTQYLDPVLLAHCQACSYELGELILLADSPAWATHIRYLAPDLRAWLCKQPTLHKLEQITCKVAPAKAQSAAVAKPPTEPRVLSTSLKTLLSGTATEISNPKLRAALLRLAGQA
jgi:hypothetical protein